LYWRAALIGLPTAEGIRPRRQKQNTSADQELHFRGDPKGETHIFWQSYRLGAYEAG